MSTFPNTGVEPTEKADAPRERLQVEPKPDPTSGMAAAEAALSESSEQGTFYRALGFILLAPGPHKALPLQIHLPAWAFLIHSWLC